MADFVDLFDFIDIGWSLDIGMLRIRFHLSAREVDLGLPQDPTASLVIVRVSLARWCLHTWCSITKIGHQRGFGRFQQVDDFESNWNGGVVRAEELGGLAELGGRQRVEGMEHCDGIRATEN